MSSVGGALTDARDEDTAAGRLLARATRDRMVDGEVVIGPKREAAEETQEDASEHTAIVLASGGLGLISLPERDHRMTIEEIDALHPGLIGTLAEPSRDRLRDGAVRWRRRARAGSRRDAAPARRPGHRSRSAGDFGPNAADHLRRTDGFAHCPDILVNCMYDPEANEVAPFEEFMGSHGGLGGWQSHPSRWSRATGASRKARSSGCGPCTTRSGAGSPRPVWSSGRIRRTPPA